MIAIDLDGTLLSPEGRVSPRVRQAVHRALQAGLLVCFATGRNWTESRTIIEAIEHYDTAVFAGGAVVMDTRKQVVLHRTRMDPQLARELCGAIESAGHPVLALQDAESGVDYLITGSIPTNEHTQRWMRDTESVVRTIASLADYDHAHTIRIGIVDTPEEVMRVRDDIAARFRERVFCHSIRSPRSHLEVLELFDPAVNKWEGILYVARQHDITSEQVVAIGDDLNDLHMIRNAGLGVAMGNAHPDVQAVADVVIGGNHEEGLAVFLDELVDEHLVQPLAEPAPNQMRRNGTDG